MRRVIEAAGVRLLFDDRGSAAGIARQDAGTNFPTNSADGEAHQLRGHNKVAENVYISLTLADFETRCALRGYSVSN
jgi:hypothetical protein